MIKRFKEYNESISGTELVSVIGNGFGDTNPHNNTLTNNDTQVIFCELDGNFYTIDLYQEIYNNYLKAGGEILDGFKLSNIKKIIKYGEDHNIK